MHDTYCEVVTYSIPERVLRIRREHQSPSILVQYVCGTEGCQVSSIRWFRDLTGGFIDRTGIFLLGDNFVELHRKDGPAAISFGVDGSVRDYSWAWGGERWVP